MTNKRLRPNSAILADLVVVTDPETGELIRKDTDEVVSINNTLSQEKEWRSFDIGEHENRARTGTPTSLAFHDMGLSTVIGKEVTDAAGNVSLRVSCSIYWRSTLDGN
jgi:transcription initiation factor TFIIIB Brf1 subunit/transcription initiation factor TFIIB